MHEAQAILLRLLRFAPGPAWHRNPAPRRTYPRRPVLMPSSRPEICPGYFEGTQAIVNLQLLTCLRLFQVILKYCRTTQARYFAMTSSREPSREPGERTDDPVRMYLREMGSAALFSRAAEIPTAKHIMAGPSTTIA